MNEAIQLFTLLSIVFQDNGFSIGDTL